MTSEVQTGELPVQPLRRLVVGEGGLPVGHVHPEGVHLALELDGGPEAFRAPGVRPLRDTVNPPVATGAPASATGGVLAPAADAHVRPAVVEGIVVDVVDDHPRRRLHQHSVQGLVSLRRAVVAHNVRPCQPPPTPQDEMRVVIVNQGDLTCSALAGQWDLHGRII